MDTEKITYDACREVVSDLFCSDNDKINRALRFICANPTPDYSKALCRLEKLTTHIPRKILCLRALCLCDPPTARKYLSAALKHQNPRLRAGGISLIPLLNPNLDNSGLLAYLLQSLSDKDKKVAATTLEALRKCVPKEKFNAILQNYFDPKNEKSCFNSLFIMYKLETEFQPYIFESCLNHSSPKIQSLARRLLPYFKKLHPELEKLLLRKNNQKNPVKTTPAELSAETTDTENHSPKKDLKGSSPFHEILKEILNSDDNRDKITILMEIRENESWFRDPFIYKTLQEHFQYESEPFVLATLVKTYARLANHENSEWPVLQKYLEHEDKRVVANTVEAVAHLQEEQIIPWLQTFIRDSDFSDKSNCRIISAGMDFLREKAPETAITAMQKLAQGDHPGTSAFIHHISQWENPPLELEQSIMELIGRETRSQDLYPLINHIARYGSLKSATLSKQIRQKLPSGEKAELLDELLKRLYERFDREDINNSLLSEQDIEMTVHSDLTEKLSTDIGLIKTEPIQKNPIISAEKNEKSISIFEDWRIILLLFLTLLIFIFIIFVIYSGGKSQATTPAQSQEVVEEFMENERSEIYSTTEIGSEIKEAPEIPVKMVSPTKRPDTNKTVKEEPAKENKEPTETGQSVTENSGLQTTPSTTKSSEVQTTPSTPEISIEKPEEPKEPEIKTTPEKSAPVDFPHPPPVRTHHIVL